jgi:hypothetical protein
MGVVTQEMPGYEVTRSARVIDDDLEIVQNNDICYLLDGRYGRIWAGLSVRYDSGPAPDGWFFLRETSENRVLNKELVASGLIILGDKVLAGRKTVQLAKVKNG